MTAIARQTRSTPGWIQRLNTEWHERALWIYMTIVVLHWLEHIVQAYQIWVMEMPRVESLGALGFYLPGLVTSEGLHFGFAVSMFAGLVLLRPGFSGTARTWWTVSLWIQAWHLIEHSLLQGQAIAGTFIFGAPVPTSVFQVWLPRPELHLIYNIAVFVPMVVAMWLHTRPDQVGQIQCTCADSHS